MAQNNQISATLSQQDFDELKAAIQVFRDKLPFLVNMTEQDRIAYPKMGEKTVSFVSKALEYSKDNPQLVPPYLDVAEFDKDMKLVEQLQGLLRPLKQI